MNGSIRIKIVFIFTILFVSSEVYAGLFFKQADFSKVVFIGDSLTAGFQNGSLSSGGQLKGFSSLIARQAEFEITLPLISEPGIPPKLQLIDINPLVIEPAQGLGRRINILEQATNLAVPGHTVNDALFRRPAEDDQITSVLLGIPGASTGIIRSQVEWAEALEPTFAFVWIGNNDVLGFATSGGTRPLTPVDAFERDYQELLHRLESTGADLIVADIPNVTTIAFFLSAEEVAAQVGQPLSEIGPIIGIQAGDFVTFEGLALVEKILTGELPPLPNAMVLNASEVAQVRQRVFEVNKIIAREAYRRNIPLVNINFLFEMLRVFGVSVNGKHLNTRFLGGLFSLDGVHPTNTAYAIIANTFIWKLNFRYRAGIKPVDIGSIAKEDPLIIPDLLPDIHDFIRGKLNIDLMDAIEQFESAVPRYNMAFE